MKKKKRRFIMNMEKKLETTEIKTIKMTKIIKIIKIIKIKTKSFVKLSALIALVLILTLITLSCGSGIFGETNSITSSGNTSNYGYVLVDRDDIYYTKIVMSGINYYSNIYKYNMKNNKEILIASSEADFPNEMNGFLSLDGGNLYFLTNYLNNSVKEASANISKVKPDGKDIQPIQLFEEDISCAFMQIVSGVIYYYDDIEQAIYSMNTNGTGKKFLCEAAASGIAIGNNKIYYSEYEKLMEIGINGGEPNEIYDFSDDNFYIDSIILDGEYIYYLDDSYSFIGRVKTDGSDNKEIFKVNDDSYEYINCFNINGGTLYIVLENYGEESNYAVLSIIPGSHSPKLIVSDKNDLGDISPLAIWNDTIYFIGMPIYDTILDSDYVWFTVKKSGGKIAPFQPLTEYSDTFGDMLKY